MSLSKQVGKLLDQGTEEATEKARALLLNESQSGNIEAQLLLADFILEYDSENLTEAVNWLMKAGNGGSGQAAYYVHRLYDESPFAPMEILKDFVSPNLKTSDEWFKKALDLSYFEALWDLAQSAVQENKPDQALALIERVLATKPAENESNPEVLADIKSWAKSLKEKIKEIQRTGAALKKALETPERCKPEELFNSALVLLGQEDLSDEEIAGAKKLLQLAADQGLVQARKILAQLR